MSYRLAFVVLFGSACSLDGLADGSDGGGSTSSSGSISASASSTGGAAEGGAGGVGGGGAPSAFTWITGLGNDLVQGTNPSLAADAEGRGSTLRMSEPAPDGAVWIVAATSGAIDPDGAGGFAAAGSSDSQNLFVLQYAADGELLTFRAFLGDFEEIDNALSVGAVVRLDAGAIAIVGTFKGGSLDLGAAGMVSQLSQGAEDGFVLRLDGSAEPTHARQLGGANAQTARAATISSGGLLLAGKLKRTMSVVDPGSGAPDAACAFSQPTEDFKRALVAVFSPVDLECSTLVTFQATEVSAAQQAHAITADGSGVYVAGSFSKQIVVPPLAAVPSSSGEDGFVVALEPDLSVPTVRWIARATSNRNSATDGVRALALSDGYLWVGGHLERGTTAVSGGEPTLDVVDADPLNDYHLPLPTERDGLVGALDPLTGDCSFAMLLGGAEDDEVRTLAPWPAGVIAGGFTTNGIAGLDDALAGGSREGFVAFIDPTGAPVSTGFVLGGSSWDYLDALGPTSGDLRLAGSYSAAFDELEGAKDFYVASIKLR